MLCSLAHPRLRPMTYHNKIMCGCAIYNTSKYFQEYLNVCRRKKLKVMKNKVDNSHGGKKTNELKLTNHILTTPFQTRKIVIHVAKMQ